MKIDVVIVNWNSGSQVLNCKESLSLFSDNLISQIIIVDNASSDGSELCFEEMSDVTLIRTGENLGFAKGCNIGAKHCSSEYILFLNPDAAIYEDTLQKVVNFMGSEAASGVGICGVQLKDEGGHIARSCARFPSVGQLAAHVFGIDRIFKKTAHFMIEWDHADTQVVDQVIGAFFFVRRTLFDLLSGFDERFFVYYEEVDFARRASVLGWSSIYLASAQAFHSGGGTSSQVKASRLFYSLRSRILYAQKHYSLFNFMISLLLSVFVEPLTRIVFSAMRASGASITQILSAYRMLFKWLYMWFKNGSVR